MEDRAFTVGQVGRLFGVSTGTIKNLVKDGRLKAWRIPGPNSEPGDRRFSRKNLSNAFGPVTPFGCNLLTPEVAFIGDQSSPVHVILSDLLPERYRVRVCCDAFALALDFCFATLDAVVVDADHLRSSLAPRALHKLSEGLRQGGGHSCDFQQTLFAVVFKSEAARRELGVSRYPKAAHEPKAFSLLDLNALAEAIKGYP